MNFKFEARNPNFETNSNDQKIQNLSRFENLKLGFASDFDIRISDFSCRAYITGRAKIWNC
jgi:hypothetical protein